MKFIDKKSRDRKRGVYFHKNVRADLDSFFEGNNVFFENCRFHRAYVGYGTYIQRDCFIDMVKIGRFCSIGPELRVAGGRHPTKDFVSTHPAFFSIRKQAGFSFVTEQRFEEIKFANGAYYAEVGSDVFIGAGVTVLDGVKIGHGAIIAAGTVVYKDVEPYAIYAGSPMRLVRHRFSQDVIDKLLAIHWWDKPVKWIKEHAYSFDQPEHFFASIHRSEAQERL